MDIGVVLIFTGEESPSYIADVACLFEEMDFSTLWLPEHVLFFPEYEANYPYAKDGKLPGIFKGMPGTFGLANFLAAKTSRIRIGSGICIAPQHNPVYLAKHVVDCDRFSEGRFDFGVGVGWQKEEYDALGIPFKERGKRMDESLELMTSLWTEDISTYHGEFYSVDKVWAHPKPVQDPRPPVYVGGDSNAALRRVATHGDGWYGYNLTAESCEEQMGRLEKQLEKRGMTLADRKLIAASAFDSTNAETLNAFKSMGIQQGIVHMNGQDMASVTEWAKWARDLVD